MSLISPKIQKSGHGPLFYSWANFGEVRSDHSPHLHARALGILSDLLRSVQMIKREWGAESKGKPPHLFIPGKTATLRPEFAVEDLPLWG